MNAFTLQAIFGGSTNLCLFLLSRTHVHKLCGTLIPQNLNISLRRWAVHSGLFRENLTDTQCTQNESGLLFLGTPGKKIRVCVTGNAVSCGDKESLKKAAMTFTSVLQEEQRTHMKIILFEIMSLCLNGNWAGKD